MSDPRPTPIDDVAPTTDVLLQMLVSAGGSRYVDSLGPKPVQWTLRLGDGTEESHRRMQVGIDRMWPYTTELFECDAVTGAAVALGVGPDPGGMRPRWDAAVDAALADATLRRPEDTWAPAGGRRGLHTECFGRLLAEMQHLHRSHPGVNW